MITVFVMKELNTSSKYSFLVIRINIFVDSVSN